MLERLVSHYRAEIRTADADVDEVPDGLARVAVPGAASDSLGESGHLVEHLMHLGHYVFAVHEDRRVSRRTQRQVKDSAVFCDVDFLAAKHRINSAAQIGLLGELKQQLEGLVRDAI